MFNSFTFFSHCNILWLPCTSLLAKTYPHVSSFADPRLSADRGHHGVGPWHGHHQGKSTGHASHNIWNWEHYIKICPGVLPVLWGLLSERFPALPCRVLHPRLGGGPHLEWDQAAVGRGAQGVRQRPLERGGLHHQLSLRGHDRPASQGFLWRE